VQAAGREASFREAVYNGLDMVSVPRFDDRIKLRELNRNVVKHTLMIDSHNIPASVTDLLCHLGEDAGLVANRDAEPGHMSRAYHAAHQNGGEDPRINIAPTGDQADAAPGKSGG